MEKPAAATERVAVFVDGANLYHAIKSYFRGVLDYGVLLGAAVAYVLVSGDGDYVEAVEYLQSEKGLRVEIVSATQCTSQALLDVCDRHTDLANIPELFRRSGPSKQ